MTKLSDFRTSRRDTKSFVERNARYNQGFSIWSEFGEIEGVYSGEPIDANAGQSVNNRVIVS